MWHRYFESCNQCKKADSPFVAKGLCARCYSKGTESRAKMVKKEAEYGESAEQLTREYLVKAYTVEGQSLADIAMKANCSRQYVHARLKRFNILLRSKAAARDLALGRNKLSYSWSTVDGEEKSIGLNRIQFNAKFFSEWTCQLAWVLGVLFTDGVIIEGHERSYGRGGFIQNRKLGLSQKEPVLLNKVLGCMECDATLRYRERRETRSGTAGAIYSFEINADPIWEDLHRLGLHSRKSLTIDFPNYPAIFLRHFVRGCWDGDGSIYREKTGKYGAHYISGSKSFIEGLCDCLRAAGIFPNGVYTKSGEHNDYFYFKVLGSQIPILYHYLYDDVPEIIRLERKAVKFKEAAEFIEARLKHLAAVRAARSR